MTQFFSRLNDEGFLKFRGIFTNGLVPVLPNTNNHCQIVEWAALEEPQREAALALFPLQARAALNDEFSRTGMRISQHWLLPTLSTLEGGMIL